MKQWDIKKKMVICSTVLNCCEEIISDVREILRGISEEKMLTMYPLNDFNRNFIKTRCENFGDEIEARFIRVQHVRRVFEEEVKNGLSKKYIQAMEDSV